MSLNFKKGHRNHINHENTKVFIEFIMDGADVKPGEDKTFPVKIVADPVITDDTEDEGQYSTFSFQYWT